VNATVDGKTFLAHKGTTWGPFDAVIDVQIDGTSWFALVEQEGERYVASAAGSLTPIGKTRYLLVDQRSGGWVAAEEQGEEVVLRDAPGGAIVSLGLIASREPNPYQDQWSWKEGVLTFADGDVYEGGFNVFALDYEGTPTAFFYAVRDNEVFYHRKPLLIP
jgi:hypothetical protein